MTRKPDRLDAACEYFGSIGQPGGFCFDENDDFKVKKIDSWQVKTPFTAEEEAGVDTKLAELVTAWEATEYQLKRTGEDGTTDTIYASIGDQLDMQYKDAINGTTTWKDHVAAVKAKYPKPS